MHGSKQFGVVLGVLVVAIALGTTLPLMTGADTTAGSENTMIDESAPNQTTDSNVADNNTTDTNASGEDTDADEEAGRGDTTTADSTDVADGGSAKAKAGDETSEDAASGGNGKAKAEDASADEGRLVVVRLSADDDGTDVATLNDEFVTYRNVGDAGLNLTGWTVMDTNGNTYTFPEGFVLAPGAGVTLYTGNGTDTGSELYWGEASEVWNDGADTMTVRNANGTTVLQRSYPES